MALTKLPKSGIADDAVDASKIEDGTIQNQELAGSLSEDKLATGTIENAKLSNSSITINGSPVSLGGTINLGTAIVADVEWQSVITAAGGSSTATANEGYFIDTTSNTHTLNLPASASIGDTIAIKDYAGTFGSNNLTIGRNGHNIQGVANDSLISTNRASLVLVYVDSTKGWIYAEESNVSSLLKATFTSATGGTVTTSGDYKIHSFTGDGCFVVTQLGNSPVVPTGGPSNVDYLVVAGGGGGGADTSGGGGGAGGYRTTFPSPGCNAGAFPISSTTYPITVGAGGTSTGTPSPAGTPSNPGTDSTFSTITSTGGGGGGNYDQNGLPGGSGGGSGGTGCARSGGTGNTPPVSPPQGNSGGNQPQPTASAGGGGGATAVGSVAPPVTGANGGAGAPNSITGSAVNYAGGAGGGTRNYISGNGGCGGVGGGGVGGGANHIASTGTANTGGGGGGIGFGIAGDSGKSGGKGIVIIRYKFQ